METDINYQNLIVVVSTIVGWCRAPHLSASNNLPCRSD